MTDERNWRRGLVGLRIEDPKALRPGDRLCSTRPGGGERVIARRKDGVDAEDQGDGWWNTDGSGFADHVLAEGGWELVGWKE